jgi:hypothetical protein
MIGGSALYLAIRNGDGTWQPLQGFIPDSFPGLSAVSCADLNGSLQVIGVGNDGQLYSTARGPDGAWQRPFTLLSYSPDPATMGGPPLPVPFSGVACAPGGATWPGSGNLIVVALSGGQPYFTVVQPGGQMVEVLDPLIGNIRISGGPPDSRP